MNYRMWNLIAVLVIALASLATLTGSYVFVHKPEIPEELRKGEK